MIDHSAGLASCGLDRVRYIASLVATDQHLRSYQDLVAPFGHIAVIDDPASLDITGLKQRSVSVHWELMFTRSIFETSDLVEQHELLDEVARLVDAGILRTTLRRRGGPITAASLRAVHAEVESGRSWGKSVLEAWPG